MSLGEDPGDLGVGDRLGQAVGAEDEDVAVADLELVDLGEDALARAAEHVGHDVAAMVVPGLLGGDHAGVDQGLDDGVIRW